MLTGKDPLSGRGGNPNLGEQQIEEFAFGKLHYLSDGGYSRVFGRPSNEGTVIELALSGESREEIKKAWCKPSVEMVKFRLCAFLTTFAIERGMLAAQGRRGCE